MSKQWQSRDKFEPTDESQAAALRRLERKAAAGIAEHKQAAAETVRASAEEIQRRMKLIEETGEPYEPIDYARVAAEDSKSLQGTSQFSRDKTRRSDAMKRIAGAMQRKKLKDDTKLEQSFNEIVESVEAAYAAAQKNDTDDAYERLEVINGIHTDRVLRREVQEGTALDEIHDKETADA